MNEILNVTDFNKTNNISTNTDHIKNNDNTPVEITLAEDLHNIQQYYGVPQSDYSFLEIYTD